jgi:hypothetical protein
MPRKDGKGSGKKGQKPPKATGTPKVPAEPKAGGEGPGAPKPPMTTPPTTWS